MTKLMAALAAVIGVVAGALGVVVAEPPLVRDDDLAVQARPAVQEAPVPFPDDKVLLVWTPGRLPDGFAGRVADLPGIEQVTVVGSDLVHLEASWDADGRAVDQPAAGFVIPLEAMAFDTEGYLDFLPQSARHALSDLGPGEALLGSTSAAIRGLEPGATLQLESGQPITLAGLVDDTVVGAAELVFSQEGGALLGVTTERYLLARHRGDRADVEEAIHGLAPSGAAVRVRGPGETPYFRHGDAVLPQALIKERFGEFAYRPGEGQAFLQEPSWRAENVVSAEVPILGEVTCHRSIVASLRSALAELEERNLGFLVDPGGFAGCWNPRYIAGGKGISRHAWGAAVDLNFDGNPTGLASAQDPRLVQVMERWGFGWGGLWLVPDPAHFEYLHPPEA